MILLDLFQSDFEGVEWDDKNYIPHELNVASSTVQMLVGEVKEPTFIGFGLKITYGIQIDYKDIFTYTATRMYSFPREYASIHLLSFLAEKAIRDFDSSFKRKKNNTPVARCVINPRNVGDLFEDLIEALTLIRLAPKQSP